MKLKAFPFINFFHWKIVKNDIKDFLNIFKKLNLKTFVAQYLAHVYIAENTSVIPVSYDKNQNYQMFYIRIEFYIYLQNDIKANFTKTRRQSCKYHYKISASIWSFPGPYFPVFSPNARKCGPEKHRIRTLFTQCTSPLKALEMEQLETV